MEERYQKLLYAQRARADSQPISKIHRRRITAHLNNMQGEWDVMEEVRGPGREEGGQAGDRGMSRAGQASERAGGDKTSVKVNTVAEECTNIKNEPPQTKTFKGFVCEFVQDRRANNLRLHAWVVVFGN